MSKKTTLDINNLPTGFYDTNFNTTIPAGAIDITELQWQEFVDNPGERVWNDSTDSVDVYVPVRVIANEQASKYQSISASYDADMVLGFVCVVNSIKMDCNIQDIDRLQGGYDFANALSETNMDIRDFDNIIQVGILIADVATMLTELKTHARALTSKKWDLQTQITAAPDLATLDLISW